MKILHWLSSNICLRAGWKITTHARNALVCPHKKLRTFIYQVVRKSFGQEGVENAISSSGMTVLTEIPPVLELGMWTMHPSVRNATGTPSNQLLGENLVSEGCYFWKQHS